MLRLTVLCLLLACTVSLSSSAVVLEDGMPILWSQTVSQLTDLPVQNGIVTPNPWNFLHRMSFYRLLIAAEDPYMGSLGTNNTRSPTWGLPLQLGWLRTSGRLTDPTGATTCGLETGDTMCISPQSWWSCVSYFVSALPFLSAAQQGLLGEGVQVQMQVPEGEDFCTTHADCTARYPDLMSKWDEYFKGLKETLESTQPDNEKKDAILGRFWAAQMASYFAASAYSAKQSHYSSVEVTFYNSWLDSVGYVAAAHFHSSLERAQIFITPLPGRVLKEGDNPPNIADMSAEENHTLSVYSWMKKLNNIMGGTMVRLWQSAMCSVTTRERGREMMEQLQLNPAFTTTSFISIISGMATSCA